MTLLAEWRKLPMPQLARGVREEAHVEVYRDVVIDHVLTKHAFEPREPWHEFVEPRILEALRTWRNTTAGVGIPPELTEFVARLEAAVRASVDRPMLIRCIVEAKFRRRPVWELVLPCGAVAYLRQSDKGEIRLATVYFSKEVCGQKIKPANRWRVYVTEVLYPQLINTVNGRPYFNSSATTEGETEDGYRETRSEFRFLWPEQFGVTSADKTADARRIPDWPAAAPPPPQPTRPHRLIPHVRNRRVPNV